MRRAGSLSVPTMALAVLHVITLTTAVSIVVSSAGATVLRPLLLFFLIIVGVAAVLSPGSAAGLVVSVAVVVGYVVLTSLGAVVESTERPSGARVLLLGASLYLAHATDALRSAAAGADLDRSVVHRWLGRLAEALVPSLAIGVVVLGLPAGDGGSPVWLLGAVAVLGAAAVPALRVRRRPWRKPDDVPSRADRPGVSRPASSGPSGGRPIE